MSEKVVSSRFQEAIETVEALPPTDQTLLIEIIRRRLIEQRRAELAADIEEARSAYRRGEVRRGTVADLMQELVGREPSSGVQPSYEHSSGQFVASQNCERGLNGLSSNLLRIPFIPHYTVTS